VIDRERLRGRLPLPLTSAELPFEKPPLLTFSSPANTTSSSELESETSLQPIHVSRVNGARRLVRSHRQVFAIRQGRQIGSVSVGFRFPAAFYRCALRILARIVRVGRGCADWTLLLAFWAARVR
jgi:hypothetical protein